MTNPNPNPNPTPVPDPDDAIFTEMGVTEDDDKATLKAYWTKEEYLRKKREARDKAEKDSAAKNKKKRGIFGGRKADD